jgi:formylglycine-generating enzyme required for sulfatase activity
VNITRSAIVTLLIASIAGLAAPTRAQCVGDLFPDGRVDGVDLGVLLAYWGVTTNTDASRSADLNSDGFVDGTDLGVLLGAWGACRPFVASLSPNWGAPAGGAVVTLTGRYLASTTSVRFGSSLASVSSVSETQIRVTVPPGPLGAVDVTVTSAAGTTIVPSAFAYLSPVVPSWATLLEAVPDPAIITSPSIRERVISSGYAWRVRHTASQIEMILVPPGSFQMGCTNSNDWICGSGAVTRQVTLTSPFYVSRCEVTQAQWQYVMGNNPSRFQGSAYPNASARPVERVSRDMVLSFSSATGLRMLTEAEWEYACRGGTSTAFHGWPSQPTGTNDDSQVGQIAWYILNSYVPSSGFQSHPVGLKAPNGFGLHDTLGNVWEWVNDYWGPLGSEPEVDPTGPAKGTNGVIRGGAWDFGTNVVSCASRDVLSFMAARDNLGFRVAKTP